MDTENWDSPNIVWEEKEGAPLIAAFTGMARGLNELANFEFGKTFKPIEYSKIFVRDPHLSFYQYGVGEGTRSVPDVRDRLAWLLDKMQPPKVTFVGVSAGGYAALLFGHLLKVDVVHAFGPQIILYKQWGIEHNDPTIIDAKLHQGPPLAPENDFRDLTKVLQHDNGKTKYKVHIGRECEQDWNHARLIQNCPGVEVILYPGVRHAIATQVLREQGRLGEVITNE